MGITNSEVIINRPDGSDFNRRIREKRTDHLGVVHIRSLNHIFITDPIDYTSGEPPVLDEVAYNAALDAEYAPFLAASAIRIEESLAEQEVNKWINDMEHGLDPWHTSPFVNSVPEFNTWDIAASESLKKWLLSSDRQELLNCKLSVDGTSNKDLTDLLVLVGSSFSQTNLRAEIQKAVNTKIELDTYVPSVED